MELKKDTGPLCPTTHETGHACPGCEKCASPEPVHAQPVASEKARLRRDPDVDLDHEIHTLWWAEAKNDTFRDTEEQILSLDYFKSGHEAALATTQPAVAPADDELDHGDTVLRVQKALGFTDTGWVSPDVVLHYLHKALAERKSADGMLEEVRYNAQRLRNVAALVGVNAEGTDEFVDGVRGVLLGQIAAKLRAALAARKPAAPDGLVDAERYRLLRKKIAIVGGEFRVLNLAPTYCAPRAEIELDSVIDAHLSANKE